MKKNYEEPQVETISFEEVDVITTSGGGAGGGIVLPDDEW